MAGSFAGLTLWVDGEEMTPRETEAVVNVRHIPGGNTSYIDLGGVGLQRLSLKIFFHSTSEFNSFRQLAGTQGQLVYFGGTFQAILMTVSQSKIFPNGQQYADASFVLL